MNKVVRPSGSPMAVLEALQSELANTRLALTEVRRLLDFRDQTIRELQVEISLLNRALNREVLGQRHPRPVLILLDSVAKSLLSQGFPGA